METVGFSFISCIPCLCSIFKLLMFEDRHLLFWMNLFITDIWHSQNSLLLIPLSVSICLQVFTEIKLAVLALLHAMSGFGHSYLLQNIHGLKPHCPSAESCKLIDVEMLLLSQIHFRNDQIVCRHYSGAWGNCHSQNRTSLLSIFSSPEWKSMVF